MPPLSPQQIANLKVRCNHINIQFIIDAIASGQIKLEDLPLMPPRRAFVLNALQNMPNPAEATAWKQIEALKQQGQTEALQNSLTQYIQTWSGTMPPQNHVEEAKALVLSLSEKIIQDEWQKVSNMQNGADPKAYEQALNDFIGKWSAICPEHQYVAQAAQCLFDIMGAREKAAWDQVNKNSYDHLMAYIRKEAYYGHEAKEQLWIVAQRDADTLKRYIADMPNSPHAAEAQQALQSIEEWMYAKNGTLLDLINFVRTNPTSPMVTEALDLIELRKSTVLSDMRESPEKFKSSDIQAYLNHGIFTGDDLVANGILPEEALNIILNAPEIPLVSAGIAPGTQTQTDTTDIYFFGVPSSGKTCVLAGLLGSQKWYNIDLALYNAGNYVNYLDLTRRHGIVPRGTDSNFVALINAAVANPNDPKDIHVVNLIDMAGEDFATKMVSNPDNIITFEDMGIGVTNLMTNTNRKVFFFIIDPSADGMIQLTLKDSDGNPILDGNGMPIKVPTSQDLLVRKMISMLQSPENSGVLKYVDTIHFIMSKADMLGSRANRDQAAVGVFKTNYQTCLNSLVALCQQYGINNATDGRPVLHTFSLGQFYIGGVYQYDATDSDKLTEVIRQVSRGMKQKGWFGKLH